MTTTEVSTLSDLELCEAIAAILNRLDGMVWMEQNQCSEHGIPWSGDPHWHNADDRWVAPHSSTAPYTQSLDRLGEVEARLREAGWLGPDLSWSTDAVTATWWHILHGYAGKTAPTEARARAEASLMALQALNSPTKEA